MGSGGGKLSDESDKLEKQLLALKISDGPVAREINSVETTMFYRRKNKDLNGRVSAMTLGRHMWEANRLIALNSIVRMVFPSAELVLRNGKAFDNMCYSTMRERGLEDLEWQLSLHNSLKLASCVGVPTIRLKSIVGEFYKMSRKKGIDLAESGVCPLYSSTDQFGPGVKKLVKAPCAMQYCPKNGVLTHCARNGLHGNIHGAELREELSHLTFTVFECGVCNSLFPFDWHFLEHMLVQHATMINVSTSPIECIVCGFRVTSKVALAAHFFFVHLSNLNL